MGILLNPIKALQQGGNKYNTLYRPYEANYVREPYAGYRQVHLMRDQKHGELLYDAFVTQLLKRDAYKNYTKEDFDRMMNMIETVESGGRNIAQNNGPARGYFQIEKNTLPTAKNRLDFMRNEYPELKGYPTINIPKDNDASKLSYGEQKVLALANMIKAAVHNGDILNPTKPKEMWIKYHWAGGLKRGKEEVKAKKSYWDDMINKINNIAYKNDKYNNMHPWEHILTPAKSNYGTIIKR